MCGRYTAKTSPGLKTSWNLKAKPQAFSSYNITPGSNVPIVRLDENGDREAITARWGFIPAWSKGEIPKYNTMNATVERIKTSPMFRLAWSSGQRCLFITTGFYEWQEVKQSDTKQPWYLELTDDPVFAIGGLWDRSEDDDGDVIDSATMITMPGNSLLKKIHNTNKRMPLIIPREKFNDWLGADEVFAEKCLKPYPAKKFRAWPVSTYMNKPEHNDKQCIKEIALKPD